MDSLKYDASARKRHECFGLNIFSAVTCAICGKHFQRQSAPSAGNTFSANLRDLRETLSAPICAICGKHFQRQSARSAGNTFSVNLRDLRETLSAPICAICGKYTIPL